MNKLTGTLRRLDANDPLYLDDPDAPPPPPVVGRPERHHIDQTCDVVISLGDIALQAKLPIRLITEAEFERLSAGCDMIRDMLREKVSPKAGDE